MAMPQEMQAAPDRRQWRAGTLVYGAGGLAVLFLFLLLGDFAWSLRERAVQEIFKAMLLNLSNNALLLNTLVGALPAAVTMLVGPAVGAWSDRTRTRLGRRVPFLLASAPIVGASVTGIAYSDLLGSWVVGLLGLDPALRTTMIIGFMVFFWTIFETVALLSNSLYFALINDTVPQAFIGRFFGAFRMLSLAVGVGFFYLVFDNQLLEIVRPVLVGVGLVYAAAFIVMCIKVKEGDYPPPSVRQQDGPGALRTALRDMTTEPFYFLVFAVIAIGMVSYINMNINSMNAAVQFGVDRANYSRGTIITYLFSIFLSYPIGWLADRYHPVYVGLGTLSLYSLAMLAGWVLVHDVDSFMVFFILHGVLAGSIYTSFTSLLPRLMPRARFSHLASVSVAFTALLTMVLTPLTGVLIDAAGRDYRMAFLVAGVTGLAGVAVWMGVLRGFAKLGGRHAYVAPE